MCAICFQSVFARLEAGEVLDFNIRPADAAPQDGTDDTTNRIDTTSQSDLNAPLVDEQQAHSSSASTQSAARAAG